MAEAEEAKDEWVPAGCRGCQQPGAGGDRENDQGPEHCLGHR